MSSNNPLATILKVLIWLCLGVIMFCPLFVSSRLFFPFIVTKTVAFSIAVEVMFAVFLILSLVDSEYKLRFNLMALLMAVYILILTLASFLGNDFYRSFWSNNERSDGILLLLHLFLFVLVLTSFFRKLKEWLYLFDLFLLGNLGVSLVALTQYFTSGGFCQNNPTASLCQNIYFVSSNGARLASSIGNSGYVGGFMVFGIFVALLLFFKRTNIWLRIYYGLVVILELFITIQTQTRGAYLALAICIPVFLLFVCFFYYRNRYLKIAAVIFIILMLTSLFSVFAYKDSALVKDNPILKRVATISLSEGTANNRLVTWNMAWQGFKERPVLGWGQENFYQVFDKYYTTKNSESWFDRSHNVIFDRLITGGIIGLISYLSLLFVPFYFLWRYYHSRKKDDLAVGEKESSKYFNPVIFSLLIISYFIQNLFIFEALVIYIPLFLTLSFVSKYGPEYNLNFLDNKNFKKIAAIVVIILLFPAVYFFNLKPLQANIDLIKVLSDQHSPLPDKISAFEDVISRRTLGNQEYRRQYFNFYQDTLAKAMQSGQSMAEIANNQTLLDFSSKIYAQLNDQISENPNSVINYLTLMDFCNISYFFNPQYLEKSVEAYQQATKLSPNRPLVYYSGTVAYYNIGYISELSKQSQQSVDDNYRLALETFYHGAELENDKSIALDQLARFFSSTGKNKTLMSLLIKEGIANKKIADLAAEISSWVKDDKDKNNAKMIIDIFLQNDPKNQELKDYLDKLK